jgi:hypothetical protein
MRSEHGAGAHQVPGRRSSNRAWPRRSRNSPIPASAPSLRLRAVDAFVFPPETPTDAELQARFDALAARWRDETEFASASSALFMNPAYQEIIGLGPAVLSLILRDLEETHDHWFWALRAITGENLVPDQERGRVDQMAERWLEWGRTKGLL